MDRGELVSDEIVIAIVADRIGEPDAAERLHPRRLSAHRRAGRGARRDAARTGARARRRDRAQGRRDMPRWTASRTACAEATARGEPVRKDDNPEVLQDPPRRLPRADRAARSITTAGTRQLIDGRRHASVGREVGRRSTRRWPRSRRRAQARRAGRHQGPGEGKAGIQDAAKSNRLEPAKRNSKALRKSRKAPNRR